MGNLAGKASKITKSKECAKAKICHFFVFPFIKPSKNLSEKANLSWKCQDFMVFLQIKSLFCN